MTPKVAVVLCVRNAMATLPKTLESLGREGIRAEDVVVIDGESTDGSFEFARKAGCRVFSDEGKGFAYARKLGIEKSSLDYTLILGPDDMMSSGSVRTLTEELNSNPNVAALATRKLVLNPVNFWGRGMNSYYRCMPTGEVKSVGNPSMYRTEILHKFTIDQNFSANEDTDWCTRIVQEGYQVWRSREALAFEIEEFNFESFRRRWTWYGEGDLAFVQKWLRLDRRRALRHFFHPLREYFFRVPLKCLFRLDFQGAAFSICCWYFRSSGFLQALRKNSKYGNLANLKGR